MIQSYESMVRDDGDVTAWNQAFDTLMKIVESGRREKHNFAPELFCLSGMEGFSFDLKIWINDYLETLEQEEDQAQMEKVCRKLLDLFAWKEEAPADLRFRLASSMLSLDKKEEAGDFCREWYLQDEDDPTAATALIYTWIAGGRLKEAQKIVDRWMEDSFREYVRGEKLKVTEDRCKEIVIRQDRDDGAVKMGDGIYEDHNGAWAEP